MNGQRGKGVAFVTGASVGIGKAIVLHLLKDGWTVYGGARRIEKMADIEGRGAKILKLDVTDDNSIQEAVRTILDNEGRIDVLVNNAGYGSYGALEDVPVEEARRQFEVNLFGVARLNQLVLPTMRKQRRGYILNVSSMGGRIWMPIGGWYHATKHALEVYSDALRLEVKRFGVKVVVIQPGSIRTEWGGISAENLKATLEGSAYRKMATPYVKVLSNANMGSSPDVVARAVVRAVNSTHPRRRYAVPWDAKIAVFVKRILPEAVWDGFLGLARFMEPK